MSRYVAVIQLECTNAELLDKQAESRHVGGCSYTASCRFHRKTIFVTFFKKAKRFHTFEVLIKCDFLPTMAGMTCWSHDWHLQEQPFIPGLTTVPKNVQFSLFADVGTEKTNQEIKG